MSEFLGIDCGSAESAGKVRFWRVAEVGPSLAIAPRMSQHTSHQHERNTIVIVGGKDGLYPRYRDAVEKHGYQFCGYENHVPAKSGPSKTKIAVVIVIVTMVSHSLLAQARELAGDSGRIVYLRKPSVTAVRQTVEAAAREPAQPQHIGAA